MQTLSRSSFQLSASSSPNWKPGFLLAQAAPARHRVGALEDRLDVEVEQRRGHHAERRQRRVAAPDRRLAVDDPGEVVVSRELLELGARIGDRRERRAASALEEVVELGSRLEGRSGLRRRDEERPPEVDPILEPPDRARMRRVEHVQLVGRERAPDHLRGEARPAHPEQHDVLEVGLEPVELFQPLEHPPRLVEPAEPVALVRAAPDRRVTGPDPVDELDRFQRAHDRNSSTRRSNSSGRSMLGTCATPGDRLATRVRDLGLEPLGDLQHLRPVELADEDERRHRDLGEPGRPSPRRAAGARLLRLPRARSRSRAAASRRPCGAPRDRPRRASATARRPTSAC